MYQRFGPVFSGMLEVNVAAVAYINIDSRPEFSFHFFPLRRLPQHLKIPPSKTVSPSVCVPYHSLADKKALMYVYVCHTVIAMHRVGNKAAAGETVIQWRRR